MKAIWKDAVLAESDDTIVVEGNHYFPPQSLNQALFEASPTTSSCPWKGQANYYTVVVDGEKNKDAAWYYAEPKEKARQIAGYVAFWNGVQVIN